MNKILKIAIIGAPVVLGGIIAYSIWRRYNIPGKKALKMPEPVSQDTVMPVSSCIFPLLKGSNGKCVEILQQALIQNFGIAALPRYGADGNWGNETDLAMRNFCGISQISDQQQLNQVIGQMSVNQASSAHLLSAISEKVIADWTAGQYIYKNIVCMDNTPWVQMRINSNQRWEYAGYVINVRSGLRMSTNDYKITMGPDYNTGMLIIRCERGVNEGYWSVNPTKIRLE